MDYQNGLEVIHRESDVDSWHTRTSPHALLATAPLPCNHTTLLTQTREGGSWGGAWNLAAAIMVRGAWWPARVRRALEAPDATSNSSADRSQDAVAIKPHHGIHAALDLPHIGRRCCVVSKTTSKKSNTKQKTKKIHIYGLWGGDAM